MAVQTHRNQIVVGTLWTNAEGKGILAQSDAGGRPTGMTLGITLTKEQLGSLNTTPVKSRDASKPSGRLNGYIRLEGATIETEAQFRKLLDLGCNGGVGVTTHPSLWWWLK